MARDRDAEADLAICEKATPEPWIWDGAELWQFDDSAPGDDTLFYIGITRDERLSGKVSLFHDSHFVVMARILRTLEKWEADLIMEDKAWNNGLPCLTQGLYDRWIALQGQRNQALGGS